MTVALTHVPSSTASPIYRSCAIGAIDATLRAPAASALALRGVNNINNVSGVGQYLRHKTKHPQFPHSLLILALLAPSAKQAYSSANMGAAKLNSSNGHAGNGIVADNITAGARSAWSEARARHRIGGIFHCLAFWSLRRIARKGSPTPAVWASVRRFRVDPWRRRVVFATRFFRDLLHPTPSR